MLGRARRWSHRNIYQALTLEVGFLIAVVGTLLRLMLGG